MFCKTPLRPDVCLTCVSSKILRREATPRPQARRILQSSDAPILQMTPLRKKNLHARTDLNLFQTSPMRKYSYIGHQMRAINTTVQGIRASLPNDTPSSIRLDRWSRIALQSQRAKKRHYPCSLGCLLLDQTPCHRQPAQ
jgi:hypothetical protein